MIPAINTLQKGWTPINIASYNGHSDIVKMLVDNGADVIIAVKVRSQWIQAFWEYGFSNTHVMENINTSKKGFLRHKLLIYLTGNFFGVVFHATSRLCPVKIYSLIVLLFVLLSTRAKNQCIQVWFWKLVRCANRWSYRYWILSTLK